MTLILYQSVRYFKALSLILLPSGVGEWTIWEFEEPPVTNVGLVRLTEGCLLGGWNEAFIEEEYSLLSSQDNTPSQIANVFHKIGRCVECLIFVVYIDWTIMCIIICKYTICLLNFAFPKTLFPLILTWTFLQGNSLNFLYTALNYW